LNEILRYGFSPKEFKIKLSSFPRSRDKKHISLEFPSPYILYISTFFHYRNEFIGAPIFVVYIKYILASYTRARAGHGSNEVQVKRQRGQWEIDLTSFARCPGLPGRWRNP